MRVLSRPGVAADSEIPEGCATDALSAGGLVGRRGAGERVIQSDQVLLNRRTVRSDSHVVGAVLPEDVVGQIRVRVVLAVRVVGRAGEGYACQSRGERNAVLHADQAGRLRQRSVARGVWRG